MADTFKVEIDSSKFRITNLVQNKILFDAGLYNYLFFDPTGSTVFPSSQTLSGLNFNLTHRLDNNQTVIPNTVTGHSNPTEFDVYHVYLRSLNETIVTSSFTTVESANIDLPSPASGEPSASYDFGGGGSPAPGAAY